jgi:hypothetical protein
VAIRVLGVAETTTERLAAADSLRLTRLGFRDDDRADLLSTIERVLADPQRLAVVDQLADRLRQGIGRIDEDNQVYEVPGGDDDSLGIGVLPMLALVATADDVAAFHRERGIDEEISWRSLSDLGQQAWVHRRTYGDFGLHTYGWLRIAWSGALYWLGRLQFNLTHFDGDWVVSTHIPEAGPLTPEAVAESLGWARTFFAEHFGDYPTRLFHCHSWLLDPQLVEVLPAESNMVRFQQLWQLRGEGREADADAIFFVFRRRGEVDHDRLPRDTSLQRAIIDRILDGGHWYVWGGVVDQDRFGGDLGGGHD